jgi:hypothetical protein
MSYGVFVKTNKQNKFLDFVVADRGSKYVKRVNMTQINERKREVGQFDRDIMEQSLRIAMMDLDYRSRNGFSINREWKKVAEKVRNVSRIGA